VEAGKKAAADVLDLQKSLLAGLADEPKSPAELAPGNEEAAYLVLDHLAANGRAVRTGETPAAARFSRKS
jgi:hypothetical protein